MTIASPPPHNQVAGICWVSSPNHFAKSCSVNLDMPNRSPLWRVCSKMPGHKEPVRMATYPMAIPKIIVGRNFSILSTLPAITWNRPKSSDENKTLRKSDNFDRNADKTNPRKKNSSAIAGATAPVSNTIQNGTDKDAGSAKRQFAVTDFGVDRDAIHD